MAYGSLNNLLLAGSASQAPAVGMGATILGWTDRYAATIVEVSKTKHRVGVKRDKVKRLDSNGQSESQRWLCVPDPNNPVEYFSRRKDGSYAAVGSRSACRLRIGERNHYYDFSF
jgi:hypothetical protein